MMQNDHYYIGAIDRLGGFSRTYIETHQDYYTGIGIVFWNVQIGVVAHVVHARDADDEMLGLVPPIAACFGPSGVGSC